MYNVLKTICVKFFKFYTDNAEKINYPFLINKLKIGLYYVNAPKNKHSIYFKKADILYKLKRTTSLL